MKNFDSWINKKQRNLILNKNQLWYPYSCVKENQSTSLTILFPACVKNFPEWVKTVVMGPGQKFLTWFGLGRVSHLWFGFEFQKFPLKTSNFQFFSLRGQKNCFGSGRKVPGSKPGWPLIYCKRKLGSGQDPSLVKRFIQNLVEIGLAVHMWLKLKEIGTGSHTG